MNNLLFDALLSGREAGNGQLFVDADGEAIMSDAEFFNLCYRIAAVLINQGVSAGDRVAVQVPKCIEALALYAACLRTGAVFLPLNTAYTEEEVRYFVDDATPALLVMDEKFRERGNRLVGSKRLLTLSAEGRGSLLEMARQSAPIEQVVARNENDLAAILYTSGTTGRSKGAMLTHGNLLSNARTLVQFWQFSHNDVLLHALPIFHTHGLFVACNILLLSGGRMIFQPGFSVDAAMQALPAATTMMGVPTFYTRLLADQRFTSESVSHMRLFISGSAPLLTETHKEFERRIGMRILERYGMTETNMNTSNPCDGDRIAGTVGVALPGVELRVCSEHTHEELGLNEIGVLHVRGPNVFSGYWQMPEKTAEELLPDGFFITGDLATIDERGYVTIVGRSKDLIISGGYNIYPREIERVMDDVPGVEESAVVGVPHDDFGEAVLAVVVRAQTSEGFSLTDSALRDQLQNSLARFKQPRFIVFDEQLPRNSMGKVQKNKIREQYADSFAS
ncbi:MAG: malonyl-CoA synthase [Granulosicoccus sp.]